MFGVLFFMTLCLQNVHGFSPVQAGVGMLPLSLTMMFAAPLGGLMTEKLGPRVPLVSGLALIGGALLLMTGLEGDSSYSGLWPSFAMVGAGLGFVVTASAEVIVGNAPVDDAGVASGLQSTAIANGSHEAFMAGLHTSMLVGAVLAFGAAAVALFVQRGDGAAGGAVAVH